ncbi:MAG TPA: DUF6010 family protein [Pyrinomonadaceae bacterium]|nr:DUF6010 family protein [Pyrinomonadaceae bacterium]
MQVFIGGLASMLFVLAARRVGPKRELKTYAAGLVLAALIYLGFAAAGGAALDWVALEAGGLALFTAAALPGVRGKARALALGCAAHSAWDLLLHGQAGAAFVPDWYPSVCAGFDLVLALYISLRRKLGV